MAAAVPYIIGIGTAASVVEQRRARKDAQRLADEERRRREALEAEDPPRMPTELDAKRASRRSMRELLRRRGRASTILTNEDSLGGG